MRRVWNRLYLFNEFNICSCNIYFKNKINYCLVMWQEGNWTPLYLELIILYFCNHNWRWYYFALQEWNIFVDTHGQRGMVVVSFGTLLHNIPEHVTIKLVDAFSQLPYTVVWQLSPETHVANLSCNIHRFEWLPLAGLLGMSSLSFHD